MSRIASYAFSSSTFSLPALSVFVLCLTFHTLALAVHISPEGMGQVLLYPHYQATKTSYTNLSITNTKRNTSKALKLRFTHPETGAVVATFNLYLSPGDMWTGQIKENKSGSVEVFTQDKSCLLTGQKVTGQKGELPKRGGLEVLEMASFKDLSVKDCDVLSEAWDENGIFNIDTLAQPPSGGLFGKSEVILERTAFGFTPIALDAWRNSPLHTPPTESKPDLSDVVPKISLVSNSKGFIRSNWENNHPVAPVTALFMSSKLINMYQADSTKYDSTDILISFPTKNFYNHNPCVLGKFKFHEEPSTGRGTVEENLQLCSNSSVLAIHNDRVLTLDDSLLTSQNTNLTWGQAHLELVGLQLHSDEGHIYTGLPAHSYSVFVNTLLNEKRLPQVQSGSSHKNITTN